MGGEGAQTPMPDSAERSSLLPVRFVEWLGGRAIEIVAQIGLVWNLLVDASRWIVRRIMRRNVRLGRSAIMAQIDPVDYGLLERKNGKLTLATQPGEQWVTHMADMNWPYTMGAAHNYTWPMLKQIAEETLGVSGDDPNERPINQLKNYVWSQIGQIPLYEILVREGYDAAKKTVNRLVAKRA